MDTTVRLHAWRIEAREYARQESRRDRRRTYKHLTPERTALVEIDMVSFFLAESGYAPGIVPNIKRLVAGQGAHHRVLGRV